MAQVSRRYIKPKVGEKIQNLLIDCIQRCSDQKTTVSFIESLLTDTEKTMLAKRIAIALMILKGVDYEKIDNTLMVSKATIWRVKIWLDAKGSGFRSLLNEVLKHDSVKDSEKEFRLDKAINDNPLWGGPGNWSARKKDQWKKVKEAQEPF
jgi:uncharacterized protein YerC